MSKITLNGKIIETEFKVIEISELQFWPDNPRIYSILREVSTENPTQEEIYEKLLNFDDHVKELVQHIKKNDGLIEPILVKKTQGINYVFEGNSRLAAYRKLAETDPIKWGRINCNVLPEALTDNEIFNLIGQYHIHTKKDWVPFERAGYLYRRHKEQKIDIPLLAKEMMISESKVRRDIEIYDFMLQYKCTSTSKWSYFEEYLKLAPIQKMRKRHPQFDQVIMSKISKDEIPNAIDIRNELNPVIKLYLKKPKAAESAISSLLENNITVRQAYERIEDSLTDNLVIGKLEKFNFYITDDGFVDNIKRSEKKELDKIKYEIKKITRNLEMISKKLGDEGKK